jgi:membrane protein DedA with SNARE-associated domain
MLEIGDGPLVYAAVLVAAIVEGEVAYVAAASLVASGHLNPVGVLIAGACGATIGDQFYFYVLRGRVSRWIDRIPALARRAEPLVTHVRRHDSAMVLLIRFAPGLRVALAAACAAADVSPLKFSVLSGISAAVWAIMLMLLIGWLGPTYLAQIGLSGWKGGLLIGVVVIVLFRIAGHFERRALMVDE